MPQKKTKKAPTVLVVFGATGDLMERKLVPALYYLYEQKHLPRDFSVIGFSRRPWTDQQFREHVRKSLKKHYRAASASRLAQFLKLFSYHQGQLQDFQAYERLNSRIQEQDKQHKTASNRLYYLAVPPDHYENLFNHLHNSTLGKSFGAQQGWARLLVEKPFGKDLLHAQQLDAQLARLFAEDQVFRIDHYLAKEVLQNIMAFRFSNNLLEDVWNSKFIEKIEIKLLEEINVEGRGEFYDGVGALLDVGQNHLLQMLALVTMGNPGVLAGPVIQQQRANVLEQLKILSPEEIKGSTLRAQYQGYLREPGVAKRSNTETYFKVRAEVQNRRWQNIPIYIESGKNFPEALKEIVVTFKHPSPCLCPPDAEHLKNKIYFRIQPRPGINIEFWSKRPGASLQLEKQTLDFSYDTGTSQRYIAEYARLLQDALVGDRTLFVSSREALGAWKFIDPIVKAWQERLTPLLPYKKDWKILQRYQEQAWPKNPARLALVGLGKMGKNLALQLMDKGYEVATLGNHSRAAVAELQGNKKFFVHEGWQQMLAQLPKPRVVWLMVPHGQVDEVLFGKEGLFRFLKRGDIIVEGGNSFYQDSLRRGKKLAKLGIEFLGVGVSGGPGGARSGTCLMIGGRKAAFAKLERLFKDVSVSDGYGFFEGFGSGHFLKMVHNGIEYGMMQALAEGFGIINKAPFKFNLAKVADLYNHGSVIESRLVGWLKNAFLKRGGKLQGISGIVGYTGEGEWTAQTAKKLKVPAKIIEQSFRFRVQSKKLQSFTGKVVSALREQFGGHSVK